MVCIEWVFLVYCVGTFYVYWAGVSHETTPCLVCWIPDITDWPTLQLKPFNLQLNLQYIAMQSSYYLAKVGNITDHKINASYI